MNATRAAGKASGDRRSRVPVPYVSYVPTWLPRHNLGALLLVDEQLHGADELAGMAGAVLRAVEQQLPGLTHGDGGWTSSFAGYVPVSGDPPTRTRIGPNPLNRAYYLAEVARA